MCCAPAALAAPVVTQAYVQPAMGGVGPIVGAMPASTMSTGNLFAPSAYSYVGGAPQPSLTTIAGPAVSQVGIPAATQVRTVPAIARPLTPPPTSYVGGARIVSPTPWSRSSQHWSTRDVTRQCFS